MGIENSEERSGRRREKRCLRLERFYDGHEELGLYLIALGQAVIDGGEELRDLTVDHEPETREINFNWGSSGP